ncbi:hypothetical protein HPP92_019144 [Vanilla planifolia]|uniref:Isopenicillin N synthase-like Fe(2+) 2OG dioxygenase domain-containing protein n=1 Tax=Vanilla planifolia TaxID=51239 RepID=A0A835QDF4_VANPL|nr:hypothetical protein HPP92_019144 [Vanilla planifolia]
MVNGYMFRHSLIVFTVLLGESFMAWSNGRLKAPTHRVKMDGSKKRYSVIYSTLPRNLDEAIYCPTELIDQEHPLMYKSFNYYDYLKFKFSDEGEKHEDALKAYCAAA